MYVCVCVPHVGIHVHKIDTWKYFGIHRNTMSSNNLPSINSYMLSNRRPVKDLRPAAPSKSWRVQVWGRACQRLMPLLWAQLFTNTPIHQNRSTLDAEKVKQMCSWLLRSVIYIYTYIHIRTYDYNRYRKSESEIGNCYTIIVSYYQICWDNPPDWPDQTPIILWWPLRVRVQSACSCVQLNRGWNLSDTFDPQRWKPGR